ncbi:MAG: hypothetical protein JKY02_00695 [Flavobacteriaceae bacterium]|nr:hypothetical protein [Flavobacteriaceae bacterium]
MASPLTMYIPIKQDANSQTAAKLAVQTFTNGTKDLDQTKVIHYATLALIPNPSGKGALALLLTTRFDLAMRPYIATFWGKDGTGLTSVIKGLSSISLNPPPSINTLDELITYINSVNLTPIPEDLKWTNFYEAYGQTVSQIKDKFPGK